LIGKETSDGFLLWEYTKYSRLPSKAMEFEDKFQSREVVILLVSTLVMAGGIYIINKQEQKELMIQPPAPKPIVQSALRASAQGDLTSQK